MSIDYFLSKIENESELDHCANILDKSFQDVYKRCLQAALKGNATSDECILEIETVLDYLQDELNTGHWSKVPNDIRRAFTAASFTKAMLLLRTSAVKDKTFFRKVLKCIDMGLLLGAPLNNNDLLTASAEYISKILSSDSTDVDKEIDLSAFSACAELIDKFRELDGQIVDELEQPSVEKFGNTSYKDELPVKLTSFVILNYLFIFML